MKVLAMAASTYGDKWAKAAGNKAVTRLSRMAADRGYLRTTYTLETLTAELREMHRRGTLSAQEWTKAKNLLARAWQRRKKSG
jgi:hypothetical protein